jgi:tRNA1(Val) A37 N6-methylase TrmN6
MPEAGGASAAGTDDLIDETTDDTLYGGRVVLRQPRRGHRVGTDAVLLAAALEPGIEETVFDLGAATGAVGLMSAARSPTCRIVLVERDQALASLCAWNIRSNGLEERARVIEADLLAPAAERRRTGLLPGTADLVLTNPPFLDATRARVSPEERRAAAHALPDGGLGLWLRSCADLLKSKGRFALVHRADRLRECLLHLGGRFGEVRLRAVHPREDAPAVRLLITAVKDSRAPLSILPPLILHAANGAFTEEAAALHRGEGFLM